ncbi:MAG: rod shape-determining protein MreC [Burkholderiales bacterium]|nr:MAG: rod shape-determining protein MreC [Burkholderiales bacterium]
MDHGPPPLFNQGVSARARLAFFSFLAIALIIVDARVQALDTVRAGVAVVLYPVQRLLLLPRQAASAAGEYITTMAGLVGENERLRREAVERALLVQRAAALEVENDRLRRLLGAGESAAAPTRLARVLYESRDVFSRKLVLDQGQQAGVRPGQPVIDERGVVGQITRVFPLTSELSLLTDREQSIAVQLLRTGQRGVVFGDGRGLELRFMPVNVDIQEGDQAVTSGIDGLYPPGLAVGTVTRVQRTDKERFAYIALQPAAGIGERVYLLVLAIDPQAQPPRPAEDRRSEPRRGARR